MAKPAIAISKTPINVPGTGKKRDYLPDTTLEKLICYADKFFSKSGTMQEKPLDKVRVSMARHSTESLARFDELHDLFK